MSKDGLSARQIAAALSISTQRVYKLREAIATADRSGRVAS